MNQETSSGPHTFDPAGESTLSDCTRRGFLHQAAVGSAALAGGLPSLQAEQPKHGGTLPLTLHINGRQDQLTVEPRVTLLDALREYLHLTGSKKGCDHGQCGACTVLIDGRRVYSCLTLAVMQRDAKITTIEGLADGERLHPLQQAFIDRDAFQCGYCTSGQICSGIGLLREGHAHNDADIREQMSGNICRCGAYPNIVAAIRDTQAAKAPTP